ncbi:methyltransferase [Colwellia sp. MEBiC06753]
MSLSNLSQVLTRNLDLLNCQHAVLINFPVDGLYHEWLAAHPKAQLHYFTNNQQAFEHLQQVKHSAISSSFGSYFNQALTIDLAVIAFPKSKAELAYSLAMIAPFMQANARVIFVGENKGGIKSAAKLSQQYLEHCEKIDSARHCSLYEGSFIDDEYQFNINDWYHTYPLSIADTSINIAALPGVFSQQGLDKGTKVLLENLPTSYQGAVLDFGCGAGVISAYIAKKFPDSQLAALDVSALAVASTQQTFALNHIDGQVFTSDGLAHATQKYDHIISNPPFHQGTKTHYADTEKFLAECKHFLKTKGQLTIVANSFLKYQPILDKHFNYKLCHTQNGFNVYHCLKK